MVGGEKGWTVKERERLLILVVLHTFRPLCQSCDRGCDTKLQATPLLGFDADETFVF